VFLEKRERCFLAGNTIFGINDKINDDEEEEEEYYG
jgi:hypothetical protein